MEAYSMIAENLNMPLVIVGGPGYGIEEISAKYHSLPQNIRKQIIFTGFVTEQDKFTLLKNANALVFPSFYEGLGLPVIEAMACGIPVLTSQKGALVEAGGEAALYVDNPYNVSEISSKLVEIATNTALREKMVTLGYKQAEKFTQGAFNVRMKKVISELKTTKSRKN